MTSVGYIATFHMVAQTQTVVFMKILLIPAWSLSGTQGSFSGCGVFCLEEQLTKGVWKASFSARCSLAGVGEQEHLYLHHALLQKASEAYNQSFLYNRSQLGWGWVKRGEANLLGRGLPGGQITWFG